ncbi:MAG TPA: hypothetical protein VI078_15925 [bacterium]
MTAQLFLVFFPAAAYALLPEPPHLVNGAVTVNGSARTWGTVSLRLSGAPDPIATFSLGTLPGALNGYALAVPMDAMEPREPGTAREGDAAQVYLDGVAAAAVTIGARGAFQTVDVSLTVAHAIVLIRGPTGTPSTTPSGGAVYLDVEAADTLGAHTLSYGWSASCPGADNGAFDNAQTPVPVWTAPVAGGTPLVCTLTVTIADGQGLSIEPSVSVTVQPTVAPDPVAQFVAGPDPSLCGEQIAFDASGSYHSNPERTIALYEWDFDYDGIAFTVDATGVATASGFAGRMTPVTVALRVTDDGAPPRSVIATRELHPGGTNRAPLAAAGGPYALSAGGSLALSGTGSSDPDAACGDAAASWEWDLDADGVFDDATGAQPVIAWSTAEALLCGGRCVDKASYPVALRVTDARGADAVAGGTVAVSLLIFRDDFAHGTFKGDPDWQVRSGAWAVLGAVPSTKYYASDPRRGGLAVAKPAPLAALRAGRLETKIALTRSFVSYANGALVFGYTSNTRYRYVRLQQQNGVWNLVLGQVGGIGSDPAGVKRTKKLTGLRVGGWYWLWVNVYDTGWVKVYFKTYPGTPGTTPAIMYKFKAAAAGKAGYQATAARAYFDNFGAWDKAVLP